MKGPCVVFSLLIMSVGQASLLAKGRTVKITINGADLAAPLEVTDTNIEAFGVYSGPGTFVNGVEGREGFIVNWSKGIVAETPTESSALRSIILYGLSDDGVWLPLKRALS